jgi:hypothetical protein
MTDVLVKVMVEILRILAIVTKEIKQSRASESIFGYLSSLAHCSPETFVKKLVGRKDIEEALQTLEKVTVEEARMAAAEALRAIHGVGDEVHGIHDAVKAVEDGVRDVKGMIRDVGDMLHGVDDRVKDIGGIAILGACDLLN